MAGFEFTIGTDDKAEDQPKRKPGRPPGSSTGRPSRPAASAAQSKQNVEQALASMGSLYDMLGLAALSLRKPMTASVIAEKKDDWQTANRKAFDASPKLAAMISGVGQTSGVLGFVVTNAMAAVAVAGTLRYEMALQRAQADSAAQSSEA